MKRADVEEQANRVGLTLSGSTGFYYLDKKMPNDALDNRVYRRGQHYRTLSGVMTGIGYAAEMLAETGEVPNFLPIPVSYEGQLPITIVGICAISTTYLPNSDTHLYETVVFGQRDWSERAYTARYVDKDTAISEHRNIAKHLLQGKLMRDYFPQMEGVVSEL